MTALKENACWDRGWYMSYIYMYLYRDNKLPSQVRQWTLLRDRKTWKIFTNFSRVREEPNKEPGKHYNPSIKGWLQSNRIKLSMLFKSERPTESSLPVFGSNLVVLGFVFSFVFIGSQSSSYMIWTCLGLRAQLYGLGYPRQPFSWGNFIERLYVKT